MRNGLNNALVLLIMTANSPAHTESLEKLKSSPVTASKCFSLAQSQFNQGNLDQAKISATQAIKLSPGEERFYIMLFTILEKQNNWQEAVSVAESALNLMPDRKTLQFQRGLALLHIGRYLDAVSTFNPLVDSPLPCGQAALVARGICYRKLGKNFLALRDLERCIARNPNNESALAELALNYWLRNEIRLAAKYFVSASNKVKQTPELFYPAGDALVRTGNFAKGIDFLSLAISANPRNADALIDRGFAYNRLKKYKESIADLNSALAIDHSLLARLLKEDSLTQLLGRRTVTDVSVKNKDINIPRAELEFRYGECYFYQQKYLLAINYFGRSLALHQNNAVRIALADSYMFSHQPKLAIKEYGRALQVLRGNTPLHLRIGECLESMGDYKNAIRYFKYVTVEAPETVHGFLAIARAYARLGKRDLAIARYNHAIGLSPWNAD